MVATVGMAETVRPKAMEDQVAPEVTREAAAQAQATNCRAVIPE